MQGAHDFTAEVYRYLSTDITVEYRAEGQWAVVQHGFVLNSEGEWEHEPFPSSRTDDFKQRTRFTLDTAFELARNTHRVDLERKV